MMSRKALVLSLLLMVAIAVAAWSYRAGYLPQWITAQQAQAPAPQTGASGSTGGNRGGPITVETAQSQAQMLRDDISAIGSLLPNDNADISAETGGRIIEVLAKDGARVEAGAELFKLDGEVLAAEIRDAEARLQLAEASYRRNETLRNSRNVAASTFEAAAAEREQARAAVELAKVRQAKLIVRAPFAGVLGFNRVSLGAYVTAGQALTTLSSIDTLKVSFSVPELFFTAVKTGGSVEVTADAVPGETFPAKVAAINPQIDANGRALQILAQLDNKDLKLRPGMLARVRVLGPERDAITISEAAVVPQGNQLVAYVVNGGQAKPVTITTGLRREGWVEVLTGLEAGQSIVTAGASRLGQGAAVKPVEKPAGS
jgi:membrane fusion protein, multidrug efflux system